jgi:4-oxalocrotonate tautomerase
VALFYRREKMPVVQVSLLEGRTTEQKRNIAKRITQTLVEEAGANEQGIVVTFVDLPMDSYASGGMLICDKRAKKDL